MHTRVPGFEEIVSLERQDEAGVARAIVDYLTEHPNAMDTAEGIAEFWVMRSRIRVEVRALMNVLRTLTERGVLEEIRHGASSSYRLGKLPDSAGPVKEGPDEPV